MFKLVIVSLLVFSVQSSWLWPWQRKTEPSDSPFVYYNETQGVETVITNTFVQEFNPLAFSLLKLIITGIKIPIPDQKVGKAGLINVQVGDVTCHQLRIIQDNNALGLYLDDGFIGLAVKFDVKCKTWFKASKVGFLHGLVNISVTGLNGNAHIALNYDNHVQNVVPKIDKIDLTFKEIDIKVDHNHIINGMAIALKRAFPILASVALKGAIKNAVLSMEGKLRNMNFGFKKLYHPIFLYPPVINPAKVRINVALVEWNQKMYTQTNYINYDEIDYSGQNQIGEIDDGSDIDEESEIFEDAVEDIEGLV